MRAVALAGHDELQRKVSCTGGVENVTEIEARSLAKTGASRPLQLAYLGVTDWGDLKPVASPGSLVLQAGPAGGRERATGRRDRIAVKAERERRFINERRCARGRIDVNDQVVKRLVALVKDEAFNRFAARIGIVEGQIFGVYS